MTLHNMKTKKTVYFETVTALAAALGISRQTAHGWIKLPDFPSRTGKGWDADYCRIFSLIRKLRRVPPERDPEREDAELRADGFDPDEMRRSCKEMDEDMKKTMGANP